MKDEITVTTRAATPDETFSLPHFDSYKYSRAEFSRRIELGPRRYESMLSAARLLQVECPHCKVLARRWCRLPNGRLFNVLHLARWRQAYAEGWWNQVTLEIPDVSGEPRGGWSLQNENKTTTEATATLGVTP